MSFLTINTVTDQIQQIVLNDQHKRLFNDVIHATLKTTMPPDTQEFVGKKIQGFQAGAGAVLFFEDEVALSDLAEKQRRAEGAIPEYSDVSSGMLQFAGPCLLPSHLYCSDGTTTNHSS